MGQDGKGKSNDGLTAAIGEIAEVRKIAEAGRVRVEAIYTELEARIKKLEAKKPR